jgi:hypothetical protein
MSQESGDNKVADLTARVFWASQRAYHCYDLAVEKVPVLSRTSALRSTPENGGSDRYGVGHACRFWDDLMFG